MRTWKMTTILALAALFVVGVSAVSAISAAVVVSTPTELVVIPAEAPAHVRDTGTEYPSAAIPELAAQPHTIEPGIPEATQPILHVESVEPAPVTGHGGIGTVEELGQFLGGDPCPGCGRG